VVCFICELCESYVNYVKIALEAFQAKGAGSFPSQICLQEFSCCGFRLQTIERLSTERVQDESTADCVPERAQFRQLSSFSAGGKLDMKSSFGELDEGIRGSADTTGREAINRDPDDDLN
jgi:hypothetical protein